MLAALVSHKGWVTLTVVAAHRRVDATAVHRKGRHSCETEPWVEPTALGLAVPTLCPRSHLLCPRLRDRPPSSKACKLVQLVVGDLRARGQVAVL